MTQNEKRRDQYSENRQKETERQRERKETKRHLKRYYCALCLLVDVSRSSLSSFPRDDDDLNFPNGNEEPLMGPRERHRIIIIIALSLHSRRREAPNGEKKRERERDKEREKVIRTFFMCVCVFMRACEL